MVDGFVVVPNTDIDIERKIKIVLLGDKEVGKTCLLLQLCYKSNTISRKHLESISNTYQANIIVEGKVYQLDLWDAECKDANDNVRPSAYTETDVFCVCFSVSDAESFRHVENKWHQEIKKHSPKTPIILVGTKTDLREAHEEKNGKVDEKKTAFITYKMGKKMKKKLGAIRYLECSALTQRGFKC
ncbi:Ras-related C3 botulinum toxin substrate 1 [Exaiptasia diaphana]|nr:Ras-related C3 botulinum toxin substrate 1 [Exaiptasia diaphana]